MPKPRLRAFFGRPLLVALLGSAGRCAAPDVGSTNDTNAVSSMGAGRFGSRIHGDDRGRTRRWASRAAGIGTTRGLGTWGGIAGSATPTGIKSISSVNSTTWELLWLCPMPKPIPIEYTVDRRSWSFLNSFRVTAGGVELGFTTRTLFSSSSELLLRNSAGDHWGAVRRRYFSNSLDVSDCVGNPLVRLEAAWTGFGGAPPYMAFGPDGTQVGKTFVNETLSSGDTVVISVADMAGKVLAQLVQKTSWTSSAWTSVHVLVGPDLVRAVSSSADPRISPVDPLVDPRVLSLYAAVRFGTSSLFNAGLFIDVGGTLALLALASCCLWCLCRWHRATGVEPAYAALLDRRNEALRTLQLIESELALRKPSTKGGLEDLRCCRRTQPHFHSFGDQAPHPE